MGREELRQIAREQFGDFVKVVVDVERGVMALGGELHADAEALLLEFGSTQQNLWGINLYPEKTGEEFIEFDSMINIKPRLGNLSRGVANPALREKIISIVRTFIKEEYDTP